MLSHRVFDGALFARAAKQTRRARRYYCLYSGGCWQGDPALTARRLCIDALEFTSDSVRCRGPTFTEQVLRIRD